MLRCSSCNALLKEYSKFCNECGMKVNNADYDLEDRPIAKKTYRLRSPILESSIYYDDEHANSHSFWVVASYIFWLFALAFIVYGIKTIYDSYTVELYQGIVIATIFFVGALICFVLPGIVKILVHIEEDLSFLAKEAKKDKAE